MLDDTDSEVELQIDQNHQNNIRAQLPQLAATSNKITTSISNKKKETKENQELSQVSAPKDEQSVCRICLTEEEESENPLLTPCKCAGSMGFIHHQCLKQWF